MTESYRHGGNPQDPQEPYFDESRQRAGDDLGREVSQEQPQQPQHPQGSYETPRSASAADRGFQQQAAAWPAPPAPTPPPYEPPVTATATAAPTTATAVADAPKRARKSVALLAAVAIVAAMIGGGTATAVAELTGSDTVSTVSVGSASGTTVAASDKGSVAGVAKAVSPAITEITATSTAGEATGSGVIITTDGEIITNNHVISGASTIKVSTSDGKEYTADVVGTDADKDLALIKLQNASGLTTATLGNSGNVAVGDEVVAIGSPEGLTGTVTSGIISALDRDVTVSKDESQDPQQGQGSWPFEFGGQRFNGSTGTSTTTYKALQTDASLNPGNSGGALINMNGEIIGINSAMYAPSSSSATSTAAGSVGLGFAIPIDTVKADLDSLRNGGTSS
jgi:putative serine protease PepD